MSITESFNAYPKFTEYCRQSGRTPDVDLSFLGNIYPDGSSCVLVKDDCPESTIAEITAQVGVPAVRETDLKSDPRVVKMLSGADENANQEGWDADSW